MITSKLLGWDLLPVEWGRDEWLASVQERHYFADGHAMTLPSALAPMVKVGSPEVGLTIRVFAALHGFKDARQIDVYPQVKFLQTELCTLCEPHF